MSGTTINPYRFGGQLGYRRDGTNRNYVRARHLNTAKGRWISRDPIGFDGGDSNLYNYVENNPIRYLDPRGLQGPVTPVEAGACLLSPACRALVACVAVAAAVTVDEIVNDWHNHHRIDPCDASAHAFCACVAAAGTAGLSPKLLKFVLATFGITYGTGHTCIDAFNAACNPPSPGKSPACCQLNFGRLVNCQCAGTGECNCQAPVGFNVQCCSYVHKGPCTNLELTPS